MRGPPSGHSRAQECTQRRELEWQEAADQNWLAVARALRGRGRRAVTAPRTVLGDPRWARRAGGAVGRSGARVDGRDGLDGRFRVFGVEVRERDAAHVDRRRGRGARAADKRAGRGRRWSVRSPSETRLRYAGDDRA